MYIKNQKETHCQNVKSTRLTYKWEKRKQKQKQKQKQIMINYLDRLKTPN